MVSPRTWLFALLAPLALGGCDEVAPCARGPMTDSVGGLAVTADEHPTGWGSAACVDCHALPALHRRGCTDEVDLAEARALIDEGGLVACAVCHGDNGVEAPAPTDGGSP